MSTPDAESYRPNVGLAIFNKEGGVLIGRRMRAAGPYQWQLPQGGIDAGETAEQAALRELREETGLQSKHVALLAEATDWLYYDFPEHVRDNLSGRYVGQKQKWFAFRLTGRDRDIRLDTHKPEFDIWRWARLEDTPHLVVPFKRRVYEAMVGWFSPFAVPESGE